MGIDNLTDNHGSINDPSKTGKGIYSLFTDIVTVAMGRNLANVVRLRDESPDFRVRRDDTHCNHGIIVFGG